MRVEPDRGPHRIVAAGRRIDAVERGARAHHVAMRRGAQENAGGIGERGGDAAIEQAHLAKQRDLSRVERVLRLFGGDEMRHQQRDAVVLGANARGERRRLVRGNAEPVHAGVDMQRRAAVPALRRAEGVPFGQFDQAADHRPRIDLGVAGGGAGQQAVEHVDRRLRHDRAQAARFGEIGHEEGLAAGAREPMRDRLEAAAIAVGLDDGGAFRRQSAARRARANWPRWPPDRR